MVLSAFKNVFFFAYLACLIEEFQNSPNSCLVHIQVSSHSLQLVLEHHSHSPSQISADKQTFSASHHFQIDVHTQSHYQVL
jgi:hypothetical protein